MADEQSDEKRISSEKAFNLVGSMLETIDARIDNHAAQLANHQETMTAMAALVEILRAAVADLQVRAGLRPSGSAPVN
jgi:hypothetical protein